MTTVLQLLFNAAVTLQEGEQSIRDCSCPLLLQCVEQADAEIVKLWWREVDSTAIKSVSEAAGEIKLPASSPLD